MASAPESQAGPSERELAAALRRYVGAALAQGATRGWRPAAGSAAADTWSRAGTDRVARTLVEADVVSTLRVQSALEHGEWVARAMSQGAPLLPHTIGRTAVEHALRACHLLDPKAAEAERVERRLNETLYAVQEMERLEGGARRHGHETAMDDMTFQRKREEVFRCAKAAGLQVHRADKSNPWIGTENHQRTMQLAERYLADPDGEGAGIPSILIRLHAAVDHGVETGLLGAVSYTPGPGGVNVMTLQATDIRRLAFDLLALPLSLLSAADWLLLRYEWIPDAKALAERDRFFAMWQRAVHKFESQLG